MMLSLDLEISDPIFLLAPKFFRNDHELSLSVSKSLGQLLLFDLLLALELQLQLHQHLVELHLLGLAYDRRVVAV